MSCTKNSAEQYLLPGGSPQSLKHYAIDYMTTLADGMAYIFLYTEEDLAW